MVSDEEFLRWFISGIAKPLMYEMEIFRSVDHVARSLDSILYEMENNNVLDENSVRILIEVLGIKFAPYIVLLSKYSDEVLKREVRYRNLVKYLPIIKEYARLYSSIGVKPPDLPLGFNRLSPDVLERRYTPVNYQGVRTEGGLKWGGRGGEFIKASERRGGGSGRKLAVAAAVIILAIAIAYLTFPQISTYFTNLSNHIQPVITRGFHGNGSVINSVNTTATPHTLVTNGEATATTASSNVKYLGFKDEYPRITIKEVRRVGMLVFNGLPPQNKALAVWEILSWVSRHVRYNLSKALTTPLITYKVIKAQTPLETIRKGSGICIDYAVLISTLLVYAHVDSYILVIFNPAIDFGHAVAVADINGKAFVLDQHIPPISLQDYYEYLLPKGSLSHSSLYHVVVKDGVLRLEEVRIPKSWLVDDYPQDSVPSSLSQVVMDYLRRYYGVIPDEGLKTLIKYNYSVIKLSTNISWISLAGSGEVGISKLYSPVFRDEYGELYADFIRNAISSSSKGLSFAWIEFKDGNILLSYADVPSPNVKIIVKGNVVYFAMYSKVPYHYASIWYYNPRRGTILAGVLPRTEYYEGIRTVWALSWNYSNRYVKAVWIQPSDLKGECIGVNINGERVYAYCPMAKP